MSARRWEDRIPRWIGTNRTGEPLGHHPSVKRGPVAVGLWAAPAVAPAGAAGAADLIVSSWDACFEGGVYRFSGLSDTCDVAGAATRAPGLFGNVDPVPGAGPATFVAASRDRPEVLLFPGDSLGPIVLDVRIAWVRG